MLVVKTVIFVLLVPLTEGVLIPYAIYHSEFALFDRPSLGFLSWGLILIGASFHILSYRDLIMIGKGTPNPLDPPKELVVSGLYRYIRNPIYIGTTLIVFGQVLLYQSLAVLAYTFFLYTVFYLVVLYDEEPKLKQRFGEDYEAYCQTVPRMLPNLKPLFIHLESDSAPGN